MAYVSSSRLYLTDAFNLDMLPPCKFAPGAVGVMVYNLTVEKAVEILNGKINEDYQNVIEDVETDVLVCKALKDAGLVQYKPRVPTRLKLTPADVCIVALREGTTLKFRSVGFQQLDFTPKDLQRISMIGVEHSDEISGNA